MKFKIDGRERDDYQLRNDEIIDLLEGNEITDEERKHLTDLVIRHFKYDLCPRGGEDNDDVFARFFGNFVNGKLCSKSKVAKLMCREHRYLQNEMFKVCLEFIKELADNFDRGYFDGRNEYAVETSKKIIDHLKEIDHPY